MMIAPARKPTAAGVYAYWSGGPDHYGPDRDLAALVAPGELDAVFRRMARRNRRYLASAVRHMAGQGIRQFLDLGCGYPVTGADRDELRSTHEAARDVVRGARVVYVDNDPEVTEYVSGVLAGHTDGIGAACADMASVRQVLGSQAVADLIDLREPCGLVFGLSLHYLKPGRAHVTAATYMSAVAAGSMAAITLPVFEDEELFAWVRSVYKVARLHNFSEAQTQALFSDLKMVDPGLGPVAACRPGWGSNGRKPGTAHVAGGIGVKL